MIFRKRKRYEYSHAVEGVEPVAAATPKAPQKKAVSKKKATQKVASKKTARAKR